MIPFFQKYSTKQYIKSKPINFGYKLCYLKTILGNLIQCDPYSSKGDHNPKLGLEGSVVTKLVNNWPSEFSELICLTNKPRSYCQRESSEK